MKGAPSPSPVPSQPDAGVLQQHPDSETSANPTFLHEGVKLNFATRSRKIRGISTALA